MSVAGQTISLDGLAATIFSGTATSLQSSKVPNATDFAGTSKGSPNASRLSATGTNNDTTTNYTNGDNNIGNSSVFTGASARSAYIPSIYLTPLSALLAMMGPALSWHFDIHSIA